MLVNFSAKAKVVADIDIYPKRRYSNGTVISVDTCTGYKQPSAPLIYEENHVSILSIRTFRILDINVEQFQVTL